MTDFLIWTAGLCIVIAMLLVLGNLEPYINELMGWTEAHRDARRRNR